MNERVRRHARLIAASLAVLLAAGVGYVLQSAGSAPGQSARAVAHVHTVAPVLAPASQQRASGGRSFVAASASPHQPAPAPAAAGGARKRTARAGVPTPAPSPRGVSQALEEATGLTPAQVTSRPVCPRAAAGHASCTAETLVLRSTGAPVRPHVAKSHSLGRVAPAHRSGAHPASVPAATPPAAGTPAYLQQGYDLTAVSQTGGANDTVAVVDPYDDPTAAADLNAYRSNYELPACTTANGCFRKVNQTGATSPLPPSNASWELEASLDLDAVSAVCPNCHILLVEATSAGPTDLAAAMATAKNLGANQISASWTLSQSNPPSGNFTFPGVATVAAAGDKGYVGATTDNYPAAFANVTAAGATTLAPASGAGGLRGFGEGAWAGGGSGCASASGSTKPSYQTDKGCAKRAYADLSADGDPATGLKIYDSGNGGWMMAGGTSLATPLIAAYYAVTGVSSAGTPAWAYGDSGLLNDITSGSNGTCAANIAYICNAGVGYDGPTGVGSISGSVVTGAPGIGGPAYGSGNAASYTQSTGSHSATLASGVYPNGLDTSWWIEYGTTNAYGQKTAATDIGSGTTPASVTGYLSHLAPGTTYHYRLVAANATGTTYGYDYTLTTPAASPTDPTAAFTSTPTVPSPGASVSFDGTTSTDQGASITAYRWVFGDGTATSGAKPTHTYAARGTYYATLIVTNSVGQTDTTTKVVTIDTPPTVAFIAPTGAQQAGTALSFDGSGSTSSGSNTTYRWDFGDGNTISGSTATAGHIYTSAGRYTVTLTVTDDLGVSATSSQQVTVDKPTAAFATAPGVLAPGATASFDPGASTDPYGSILDYSWDFGDGTTQDSASNAAVTHAFTARNDYTVKLTITNSLGQMSTISHTVVVDDPPTAAFTTPSTVAAPNASISFDATQSSAGLGGTIRQYNWSFGDGATADTDPSPTASHSYGLPGVYAVTLTVTDDLGVTALATQQVTVDQPTAAFTGPATAVAPKSPATFDPGTSTDPYGSIVSYSWDFGDGIKQPGTTKDPVIHWYTARGKYIVALSVTNSHNQTSAATRTITIDTPPTAAFTPSATVAATGSTVGFDGTASTAAPGGAISDYRWSFGDGSLADSGTQPHSLHAYATPGTYMVTLTATDDLGLSASAVQHVTVDAPVPPVPANPPLAATPPAPLPAAPTAPAPNPAAASPLTMHLSVPGKQHLVPALAHGLRVTLALNQSAGANFQITIRPAHTKRTVVLLRTVRRLGAGGHTVTLKLSPAAARRLAATGSLVLTVRVTLTGADGATLTRTAKITLIR